MRTSALRLPPLDKGRSGHTGWHRAHWEAVADHLLDAVNPYATPGHAQYRLPGRQSKSGVDSDGLEGYARTFLLAAFRIAGARGEVAPALIERYAQGLGNGTDPGHRHAWAPLTDHAQQLVEAASIALALHETRPWLFDRLSPAVQARVVDWLAGFVGKVPHANNWVMFQVVVEQFLANVGGPHDAAEIERRLAAIEEWYVGDGWYTDGDGQHFDYYCGWALHFYPLLWARMAGDAAAAERYRDRLRLFLAQYQHLFAADGAPTHQGRSLTYRFATVAPLWLGAMFDALPDSPGGARRIASGVLRHFVERGAPDERGLLTLGWYRPFLPAVQAYSGPASPYWASKGFLGLVLPSDHPVWTDPERAAPIDDADQVVAMPGPGWLLHATRHDGIVRLLNHGSDRFSPQRATGLEDPHYTKLGYSTHTAPETGSDAHRRCVDGHLAVVAPDGSVSRRRRVERIAVLDRFAASRYEDKLQSGLVRVISATVVHGRVELRAHLVEAPAGHAVREGGYALAADSPPAVVLGKASAVVRRPDGVTSAIVALHGYPARGAAAVSRALDANAFGPCSATPFLSAPNHPGTPAVYVSAVVLSGDPVYPSALRAALRVTVRDQQVSVVFPPGERVDIWLGDEVRYRRDDITWPAA
jgi:hypothetical protein